jgi:outer membrane protein assembly factor BamB
LTLKRKDSRMAHLRVLAICVVLLPAAAFAGDWPQFRGPNGTGLADESQVPVEWGPDKNVMWKVKIPGVAWSSPIIWGDKVFVTTAITDKQTKPRPGGGFGPGGFGGPPQPGQIMPPFLQDMLNLTAEQKKQLEDPQKEVDRKLGMILTEAQKKQLKETPRGFGRGAPGGGGPGRFGPGGFGGPPQLGQILPPYLQQRLDLTDDQKKQLAELQKEVDGKLEKILTDDQKKQLKEMREGFGRGGPGRIGGPRGGGPGRFGPGGFGGGRPPDVVYRWQVYCLDRDTGKVVWKQLALEGKPRIPVQQSNTYATETPVTDGERVYAYFGMHGLFCYDFAGKLVWKKDLGAYPTQMGQGPASSPVLDGERVFLQIDNEEKSFLVALDKKTGDELWRVDRSERTNHCSPLVWKNKQRTELVTSGSQKVRSYDPTTGKVLWELGMGGGRCYSTPVGDSELLYVGCEAGFGGFGRGNGGPEGPGGGRGGFGGGGGGLFAIRAGTSGDLTLKEDETSNAGVAWSQTKAGPEKASPLVYQGHLYVLSNNTGIVTCYDAKTGNRVYRERVPGATNFWASPWACDGKIFCLDDGGTTHVLQAGPKFKVLGKNASGTVILRSVDNLYCIKR